MPIPDGFGILELKDDDSWSQAVTSPAKPRSLGDTWPEGSPEVIALHPKYIEEVAEKNKILNVERINKAIHPFLPKLISIKLRRWTEATNVDLLTTPEFTFLHEVGIILNKTWFQREWLI